MGSRLKLSALRSNRGFNAGAEEITGGALLGVGAKSSGSEGNRDLVELQSEREDKERRVTEGDGSMLGRIES